MKLGLLIAAEQTLQDISLKVEIDGVRAYKLRKELRKANDELKDYQATRDEFVHTHSQDNQLIPGRDKEAIAELSKLIAVIANEDIDLEIEAILKPEDFIKISVNSLMILEELGLLHEPKERAEVTP